MDVSKIIKTIADAAPLLGSLLPLPGGAAIGALIASEFGADPTNMDDILAKIKGDPESTAKLKALEYTHKEKLQEIALEGVKLEVQDTQNARTREVELAKLGKTNYVLNTIQIVVIIGFIAAIVCIMATKADSSDHDILNMMLGVLASAFTQVLNYQLGRVRGQTEMTNAMATITQSHAAVMTRSS